MKKLLLMVFLMTNVSYAAYVHPKKALQEEPFAYINADSWVRCEAGYDDFIGCKVLKKSSQGFFYHREYQTISFKEFLKREGPEGAVFRGIQPYKNYCCEIVRIFYNNK